MTTRLVFLSAACLASAFVGGCGMSEAGDRPSSQPLDRLLTAEARHLARTQPTLAVGLGGPHSAVCPELIRLARENDLIVKGEGGSGLAGHPELWQRLPEEARAAITVCMKAGLDADGEEPPLDVVAQQGRQLKL